MSKYGIKVSRPGVDVKTASDSDLVYSSEFYTFKIHKVLKFTSASSQAHGLGYPPTFLAFEKVGNVWRKAGRGYYGGGKASIYVNGTNVTSNSANEIYVILFTDPLNE